MPEIFVQLPAILAVQKYRLTIILTIDKL